MAGRRMEADREAVISLRLLYSFDRSIDRHWRWIDGWTCEDVSISEEEVEDAAGCGAGADREPMRG